jgi:hypothetical protein
LRPLDGGGANACPIQKKRTRPCAPTRPDGLPSLRHSEIQGRNSQQELDRARRYSARSIIGWRRFGQAVPNDAHYAELDLGAVLNTERPQHVAERF